MNINSLLIYFFVDWLSLYIGSLNFNEIIVGAIVGIN